MRLDLNSLSVQTFETTIGEIATPITVDTGKGGPDSLCYICYETGNYVPSCNGYDCGPLPIDPETHFYPCTRQLTCVGCA